jgi:hypothetical protein
MSMSRLFGSPWSSVLRKVLLHAKRLAACPIRPLLTGAMLAARLSRRALRICKWHSNTRHCWADRGVESACVPPWTPAWMVLPSSWTQRLTA